MILLNIPATNLSDVVSNFSIRISFTDSFLILTLSVIFGFYLRYLFNRYTSTYSSKIAIGNSILLITIGVSSLIAVVKSSLALSLGLVGALSVIRFRTAIKEPYNLAFFLLSISVGISIGASQYLFAILLTVATSIVVIIVYKERANNGKFFLGSLIENMDTLAIYFPNEVDLNSITNLLSENTDYFNLISLDQSPTDGVNIVTKIKIEDHNKLTKLKKFITAKYPDASINFYSTPSN